MPFIEIRAEPTNSQFWANFRQLQLIKAAALASYAKQAKNDTLYKHAVRIQSRAIARAGELLSEIEAKHGANQNIKEGDRLNVQTRTQAAKKAGLSEWQQKTALIFQCVDTRLASRYFPKVPSKEHLPKSPLSGNLPTLPCALHIPASIPTVHTC